MSDISFDDLIPKETKQPQKAPQQTPDISFDDLIPDIDDKTGAPMFVRLLAGAVDKPEDKLATVRKYFPDAAFAGPPSTAGDQIVFTHPETGRKTLLNPPGLDVGDAFSVAREGMQVAGGTLGAGMGAPGGLPGIMAGSGLGVAMGEESFNSLARLIGTEDTRNLRERFGDAAVNFVLGSLAGPGGAVTGAGARAGTKAALRGGKEGRQEVESALADLARFGETPSLAQATQKPALDSIESFLSNAPGGAGVIRSTVQRVSRNVQTALDRKLRQFAGREVDPEVTGRIIQEGLSGRGGFVDRFRARSGRLFDQLDTYIQPNTPAAMVNTRQALQKLAMPVPGAEETSAILASPTIRRLQAALKADFGDGNIPFAVLKQIRSDIGSKLSSFDLISDIPRGDLKQLYGAISDDLRQAVMATGNRRAISAYERANNFYRAGIKRVDDVIEPLLRKRTPEQVFDALERGTRRGASQVRAIMRSLSPVERKAVVTTMMQNLGRARPGQQGAEGIGFSFETFLTNWNKMDARAKSALLDAQGMKQLRSDMDALARAAERMRESSKAFANPSGTAGATVGQAFIFSGLGSAPAALITGEPGFLVTGPAFIAMATMSTNQAAKLMVSPRFVRWLARGTKVEPNGVGGHLGRLVGVAEAADSETADAVKEFIGLYDQALRTTDNSAQ